MSIGYRPEQSTVTVMRAEMGSTSRAARELASVIAPLPALRHPPQRAGHGDFLRSRRTGWLEKD
jgi:hypothetical protein